MVESATGNDQACSKNSEQDGRPAGLFHGCGEALRHSEDDIVVAVALWRICIALKDSLQLLLLKAASLGIVFAFAHMSKLHSCAEAPIHFDAFPFPPYPIQQELMESLYSLLQKGGIGLFESPTGMSIHSVGNLSFVKLLAFANIIGVFTAML